MITLHKVAFNSWIYGRKNLLCYCVFYR